MPPPKQGLYDPAYEHDACGVAFVARLDAVPSHETVQRALTALANLEHRGAEGADANTGDGAGITVQLPDAGMVPVASATLAPPLAAVTAPPAHVVAPEAGVAFTRPAGYVSVNAAPVIAAALGLVSVIVSVEVTPTPTVAGAKAFAIVGCRRTVSVEDALAAVPALVVVTLPVLLR